MAGRAVDAHAPAVRADGPFQNTAHVGVVDRDKAVHLVVGIKPLGAAGVAVAFFADGTHKPQIALGFNTGFVKAAQNLKKSTLPRAVVADAGRGVAVAFLMNRHVGSCGKHRIHVGAQRKRRALSLTRAVAHDVADLINRDVG